VNCICTKYINFHKYQYNAIIDYISPALCSPVTPSRPIPFSANAAATERSLVLHDVIGDRMIPFAANVLECTVNGEENPFPAIGDAPYRKHTGGGPSHGHRQYGQKFGKDRASGSGDILSDRQTDALVTILRNRSRRRSNNIVNFLHFTNLHSNLALLFSGISLGYMKLKHNRQSPNRLSVLFKGKATADLELH